MKTFECLGELSISCVTRYLVIFCVKTQPSEKLYLSKKDLQFAYGIWPLENSLAWRFVVGKSTACEIVNDVCEAIVDVLLSTVLKWPTGGALRTVVDGFLQIWGSPQCAGAIDGTHIPIVAPPQSSTDYYNRKGFYSIVLQAVVDHKYRYNNT